MVVNAEYSVRTSVGGVNDCNHSIAKTFPLREGLNKNLKIKWNFPL